MQDKQKQGPLLVLLLSFRTNTIHTIEQKGCLKRKLRHHLTKQYCLTRLELASIYVYIIYRTFLTFTLNKRQLMVSKNIPHKLIKYVKFFISTNEKVETQHVEHESNTNRAPPHGGSISL